MSTESGRPFELPIKHGDIARILPHRYPFLLIDRVVELEPGKRLRGYKNLTLNEDFFNGHFPGLPVMPGVLQLEAMAQASAILTYYSSSLDADAQIAYLMSMNDVKFRRVVEPGDRLDIEMEVLRLRRGLCKVKGTCFVDGERASEAVITAAIRDRPEEVK